MAIPSSSADNKLPALLINYQPLFRRPDGFANLNPITANYLFLTIFLTISDIFVSPTDLGAWITVPNNIEI